MKRSALCLTVLSLSLLAAPAAASDAAPKNGCGGGWEPDRKGCSFVYEGGPVGLGLSLYGDPAGAGVVRLERPTKVRGVHEVLLTCEAAGTWSGCGASMTSTEPIAPLGSRLYCVVEGRSGTGNYGCSSGG